MKKQTEIEEIRKTGEQDCEKLPNQAGNIRKKYTKIVEKFYTLCYNKTIGKISEGKGVRMMKRKSLQTALLAAVMGVVSMPHAVLAADAPSEAAAAVNTWIGYQLRDDAGQYLTVANGAAETGSQILSYAANGVAAYNIWYFTETGTGTYTLKSSLSEGEFYATASDRQTLELQLQQDGMQQQFTCTEVGMNRIHLQQNETDFGTYTLEPVTWLKPGDVNRDGVVNVLDLSLAKRLVLQGGSSDFCAAALADADGNGTLDAADLAALQGFLMQRQTAFPAETVTLPENTIFPVVEPEQTTTTTSIATTTTAPEETTTTTTTTTTINEEGLNYGDVNLDGVVDLADCITVNKYLADVIVLSDIAQKNADVDRDNNVGDKDVSYLMKFVLNSDEVPDLPV